MDKSFNGAMELSNYKKHPIGTKLVKLTKEHNDSLKQRTDNPNYFIQTN